MEGRADGSVVDRCRQAALRADAGFSLRTFRLFTAATPALTERSREARARRLELTARGWPRRAPARFWRAVPTVQALGWGALFVVVLAVGLGLSAAVGSRLGLGLVVTVGAIPLAGAVVAWLRRHDGRRLQPAPGDPLAVAGAVSAAGDGIEYPAPGYLRSGSYDLAILVGIVVVIEAFVVPTLVLA